MTEVAKIELPDSMRNNVVMLDVPNADDGSSSKVYLIGVSHVSKVQAEQVEALSNLINQDNTSFGPAFYKISSLF